MLFFRKNGIDNGKIKVTKIDEIKYTKTGTFQYI